MKKIFAITVLAVLAVTAQAQSIASVLREIERNNIELQAVRSENRTAVLEIKGENTLDAPSVEYSPFFRSGASGVASSELVVSQDFDFPTLYAARSKSGRLQQNALELEYMTARRNILLGAQQKCLELVLLTRMQEILTERMVNADDLLQLFETKVREGYATGLELNKIKLERMDLQTEKLQNETARQRIIRELTALNGNQPLRLDSIAYPDAPVTAGLAELQTEIMTADMAIQAAEAGVAASVQATRVSKQGWLPKLAVGYRRNTELDEASNGFMVGASFPIFSNANKVKAAKSKQLAAQLNLNNTKAQVENQVAAQVGELHRLDEALRIYDLDLMRQSLVMLKNAVTAGSMSLVDYYTEADKIYQKQQTYLTLENQYHNLWAELHKNRL